MMGDFHANDARDFAGRRDHGQAGQWHAADNLPGVQPHAAQQNGSLPIGDIQAGWDRLALLALCIFGGAVL